MKHTRKSRIFSLLLCCLMLVGVLPLGQVAYAAGEMTVNVAYDSSTCTAAVSWDAVPGASRYLVSLENDNESGTGWSQAARTQSKSITTTSCTFDKDDYFLKYGNGGDNYKVSVVAYDASNNSLASGESAVFQTGLSPLSAPTVTFDSTGVATWTAVSGADRYYFRCFQNSSYPVHSGRQSELTMDFSTVLVPGNEYFVEVNAIGNGTTTRNSKEAQSNTITVAGSMENVTGFKWSGTTLSWDSFSGADSYDFWVTKKVGGVYVQQGANLNTVNNYYDFETLLSTYGEGNYIIHVTAVRGFLKLSNRTESPAFDYVLASIYTVSFNTNGHGTAPTSQNVYSGNTATKPADPTASGWKFGGWYREAACTNAFDFSTPITGSITLYAKWTQLFNVTFNANGHGAAPTYQTVESGKTAIKPDDPSEDGWIFRGWYTDAACTNAFDFSAPITSNIALYAKWTERANTHGIIFDNGGGTGTKDSEIGLHMSTYICPPADTFGPPSADKEFDQWEVTIGKAAPQRMDPGDSFYLFGDTTIKALWKDKGGTSTFAFTTQPVSGTAKKTEDYTYSWALSDTPDSILLQAFFGDSWHDGSSLMGLTSDTVSYSATISKYRIKATKGSETIYSNEFTVTWTDESSSIIDAVTITGVTPPSVGATPTTAGITVETPNVQAYNTYWADSDGNAVTTPFESGKTYQIVTYLKPVNGYSFADTVTATVNGMNADYVLPYGSTDRLVMCTIPMVSTPTTISSVTITGVTPPSAGATPTTEGLTVETPNVQAYNTYWADSAGNSVTGQFEAGKTYQIVTYLKPADGYSFADTVTATVNGMNANYVLPYGSTDRLVMCTIPFASTTTHTVTFNANGHGTAPAAQTVEEGKTATKPADPTASGWKFGGWYKEAACTNAFDFSTAITGNITLYAKWTKDGGGDEPPVPTTYTVTFNSNGHGTAPAAQTVEDGKTATKPTDPTASGWTFKGWYKDKDCKNAFDFSTPITGNITLYAKWMENGGTVTPDTYTVTFDANGHGTAPTAQTVEDGKTATKPDDPTETGWKFDGWYTEAACTNAFDFSTPITGNVTLYAKWTENSGGQNVSPQTGDNSHLGLWIALMAVSLIGLGGVTVFRKDRKRRYKHSSAR